MTAATIARYLIGDRAAILAVAASRRAWLVGMLLVLGAGLAREYDHEDLVHEPWHALLPLAASLVTATILYLLLRLVSWRRSGSGWPAHGGPRAFLGLYWATAPLAWLYALPVERVLSVGDAVAANLWLLAIVSAWRVLLMTRVVQVVWRCHWIEAFHVVGCFAWGVAAAVLSLTPLPLLSIMGGIELGPGEAILAGTTFIVMLLSWLSAPWWLGAIAVILLLRRRPGGAWTPDPAFAADSLEVEPSAWRLGAALVGTGCVLLPFTQPEQWRRHAAETALRAGDVRGAIATLARHDRGDYPPHWDPPPRPGYRERLPGLVDLVTAIAAVDPPAWVREAFLAKAQNLEFLAGTGGVVARLDDDALAAYVAVLERLPEGPRLASIHARGITTLLDRRDGDAPALSATRQECFARIRHLATDPVEAPDGQRGAEPAAPGPPPAPDR